MDWISLLWLKILSTFNLIQSKFFLNKIELNPTHQTMKNQLVRHRIRLNWARLHGGLNAH